MKERPILFSAPMVRALLDGTKTQTRRVVKPQPDSAMTSLSVRGSDWNPVVTAKKDGLYSIRCPYGRPGDRLWVRETWKKCWGDGSGTLYCADERGAQPPWKPSIFLPRDRSRITLEITAIRVERLNEISEADAKAEGVTVQPDAEITSAFIRGEKGPAQLEFWDLWRSINGPGSWELNPWVWVLEFRKLEGGAL